MNQRRKFTEDFKQEAAAQVIERGYPIKDGS
jgi:transposase-like protein